MIIRTRGQGLINYHSASGYGCAYDTQRFFTLILFSLCPHHHSSQHHSLELPHSDLVPIRVIILLLLFLFQCCWCWCFPICFSSKAFPVAIFLFLIFRSFGTGLARVCVWVWLSIHSLTHPSCFMFWILFHSPAHDVSIFHFLCYIRCLPVSHNSFLELWFRHWNVLNTHTHTGILWPIL